MGFNLNILNNNKDIFLLVFDLFFEILFNELKRCEELVLLYILKFKIVNLLFNFFKNYYFILFDMEIICIGK